MLLPLTTIENKQLLKTLFSSMQHDCNMRGVFEHEKTEGHAGSYGVPVFWLERPQGHIAARTAAKGLLWGVVP